MDLSGIELLCSQCYGEAISANRGEAQRQLSVLATNLETLPQVRFVLENSQQPYAQHMAAGSLTKLITSFWGSIPAEAKMDLRNFALQHLATFGAEREVFVVKAIVQIFVRITKLAWFDHPSYQDVVEDISKFLQASVDHCIIGMTILYELVQEMNTNQTNQTITKHRKASISFRDLSLLRIFQIALTTLKQMVDRVIPFQNPAQEDKLLDCLMKLTLNCLSYDFIGTCVDESTEDVTTVQIPSSWRAIFEDMNTLQLFFDVYNNTKVPRSAQALRCLVQMASVRRSLFAKTEIRQEFLTIFMSRINDILRRADSVTHHANFHEFCRLLARLKGNFQLSELAAVECYGDWIQLVATFTLQSFQSWQWSANSVYYLLNLWSKLVASAAYIRCDGAAHLDNYVPAVLRAFIMSRLDNLRVSIDGDLDDPLENQEQLLEQLEAMPVLCRFHFETSSQFIISLFDDHMQKLQLCATAPTTEKALRLAESGLTWLTYIIGCIVGARLTSRSCEEHEIIDGELCARAFRVIQWVELRETTMRGETESLKNLELAIVAFLQQFRKSYIGEQASIASQAVYVRLNENVGIPDNTAALNAVLARIVANLKCWPGDEEVIDKTLSLFDDLAQGYSSGKKILELELVQLMLRCHTVEHFPFLIHSGKARHRTSFYGTLTSLLLMNENMAYDFEQFLSPFVAVFTALQAAIHGGNVPPEAKPSLIGVLRDLRGVCMGTRHRHSYSAFFEWFYPDYFPILPACVSLYWNDPDVMVPLLKLVAEVASNKCQRIQFESSSPQGILLFREISKVMVAYGQYALQAPVEKDIFREKFRPISWALTCLSKALASSFVNLGVFALYEDKALDDALQVTLRMALSMPLATIVSFKKVASALFVYIDVLCTNCTNFVINLESSLFVQVMAVISEGIKSSETAISSGCASALDQILSTRFKHHRREMEIQAKLDEHLRINPELLPSILTMILEIVVFEGCPNQWSLSRPLLPLVLMNEEAFGAVKQRLAATFTQCKQVQLAAAFDKLMADIQRNLESKNRDRFTQNLSNFRQEIKGFLS